MFAAAARAVCYSKTGRAVRSWAAQKREDRTAVVVALVTAADVAADGGDVAAQCSAARANAAVSSSGQLVYSAAVGEAIWLIEARSEVSAIRERNQRAQSGQCNGCNMAVFIQ